LEGERDAHFEKRRLDGRGKNFNANQGLRWCPLSSNDIIQSNDKSENWAIAFVKLVAQGFHAKESRGAKKSSIFHFCH
jgi:hypothetical protein